MAKCRRCGSVKGVGRVKTMSPGYARTWVQSTPTAGYWTGGFSKEFDVCMAHIIEMEAWMEGKDFRPPGQSGLEDSLGTTTRRRGSFGPLLEWLLDASIEWS